MTVTVLLLILAAGLLLGTATGNRWLLHRLQPLIPGTLTIDHWQGNLLDHVQLQGLHYQLGHLTLDLDRGDARLDFLALLRGWLQFDQLHLDTLALSLTPSSGHPAAPLPDSVALPFGIAIDDAAVETLIINDDTLAQRIRGQHWRAWRRFKLTQVSGTIKGAQIHSQLQGQLQAPYRLKGNLDWQSPLPASDSVTASQAKGSLTLHGPLTHLTVHHRLEQPIKIDSRGLWLRKDDKWQLDLTHQWSAQPLPLTLPQPLSLGAGELHTRGPLTQLSIDLDTRLQAGEHPLTVTATGSLSPQQLRLSPLTVSEKQQQLQARGTLSWAPLTWDLSLQGQLDPQWLLPALPGALTLTGSSRGQQQQDRWQLANTKLTLDGQLRQQPFQSHLSVTGNSQTLSLSGQGQWGSNHIHVDGQIGAALDLHGTLAMSQLALLTPQSGGRLNGTLQLTGTPTEPQLSGTLNGHHLRWLQWQLGHLKASFSQLGPGPQAMSVSLQGDSLKQQDALRVQRFSLEGKGKRQQHHLTLSLQQQGVNLQSQFQGGLDPHWQWQGQLQDTRLSQPSLGQWRQRQHAALTLGAHRQQLSRLCLDNGNSNLCLQGQHDQHDRIESQITITALPLALADSLLPPTAGLQGKLDARLALNGTLKAPRGQLSMAAQQAQLLINDPDHPQRLPIRTLSLHSQLNQGRADNRLSLESPLGEIHAQVESGLSLTDPMTGTVDLSAQSLAPLALFTADLRDIDGQVQGHLKLAGSPQQPVLNGQLQLQQGHFQVPRLGIAVEQIHVRVQGSPLGRLDLQGQATLGGQPLIMAGEIDPTRQPFILNLRAHGKNLLIANRPDARLHVTPDLTLSHEQGTLALRGELLIPDAEIRPLQLPPDAITVSDDQVLVHQNIAANTPLPLDTRLTLKLGDQVHFNGFGLDAMLGGSLQVQQAPRSPMQLNGELLIREGRYKAYGQNLGITDGRLLFQGPPDNPGLDIRAIRKIPSENIIAGVQLSGTLKQPSASVFSDPPMGESQAMAYLLTGHSLERGSSSDSAHVAQALALYGLEKGSGVTDKIGNKLGLDQVTLGSDWETSDAALMLGKQLSERLYLSYSVGLFDALSTVMLRYTLSRQIHLEARSNSKANSLDLIWEKELE